MDADFSLAVHAMVYMAHRVVPQKSASLADNICTNPARVRKVMAPLTRQGLVVAKEGFAGGYSLAREAETITLGDIADALSVKFVSASWKSGDTDRDCLVSSGMGKVMDAVYQDMDRLCRNHAFAITVQDIVDHLFKGKEKK